MDHADEISRQGRLIDDALERAAFLDGACAGDAELRAAVEARLRSEDETATLSGKARASEPTDGSLDRPGDLIGRYRLIQPLGEGGFGTVWMAEQVEPVKRRVAVKLIKEGMDSRRVIARFAAERQTLAVMDHPGIAKVLDAGTHAYGRPYFVMELVEGDRITKYCERRNLSTRDRLRLFIDTCNAVQHAHQKGIIHRDIKPSNVLVTEVDGRPVPKVIDFGIAKATAGSLMDPTMATQVGHFVGTPAYMSPEQFTLAEPDIDTRSDIYSLGVLLYELLTGTTPFDPAALSLSDLAGMQRILREQDPPRPSTRVIAAEATGGTEAKTLRLLLRGDLDWIVMKALEKDRARRYETANGLAADIDRHLRGEPVVAAPPSLAYRAGKFVRRNRGLVAAAALLAAALLVGIAGTTWGFVTATRQRKLAEARAAQLEQVAGFQSAQLGGIDVPLMAARLREDLRSESRAAAKRSGAGDREIEARLAELEGNVAGVDFAGMALHTLQANVLEPALAAVDSKFADQPVVRARLLQTIADTARNIGLFELAARPQAESLRIRRAELGDDAPDTMASIEGSAELLADRGHYDEAERLFQEAIERRRRVLGNDAPDTLASIAGMGTLRYYQGRNRDAEPYYREALEARRRVLGEDHPDTVSTMRSMGYLLIGLGRLDEAVALQQQALEVCRRTLGDDDPGTVRSRGALADALAWQGRWAEAERYHREALESRRRILGSDHPDTLSTLSALGVDLQREGKLDEAERCLRDALERQQRVLGEDSSFTLQTVGRLGVVLFDLGRYADAEPYYRRALDGRRRVLGADHPNTLVATHDMGVLLLRMGRHAEAEASLREALERSIRVSGPDHVNTLRYRLNLGRALLAEGRWNEAESQLRQALDGYRRVRGDDSEDTADAATELGRMLTRTRRYPEAEALLTETSRKPRSGAARTALVDLYIAWDEAEPGRGYDRKAEEARSAR